MQASVVKFEKTNTKLLEIAASRRENGDFIGALCVLKNMLDTKDKSEVFAEIAETYMLMDCYGQALEYWFRHLSVCHKADRAACYNAIGTCYYLNDNYYMAGYYYEKQLAEAPDEEFEYQDQMYDYFDLVSDFSEPEFHICYPEEKIKPEILIAKAEHLSALGDYKGAIATLEKVNTDDEFYLNAKLRIAAAYLFMEKPDEAEEILKRLSVEFPDDKLPVTNLACFYASQGRREESLSYFEKLDGATFEEFAECYKVATAYCDLGDDKNAEKYLKLALLDDPYEANAVYLLGIVEFNLANYDDAAENFSYVYKITGNPVAEFYYEYALRGKTEELPRLEYIFNLPKDELRKWISGTSQILTHEIKVKTENLPLIFKYADWIYSFGNRMQIELCNVLLPSKNAKIRKYYIDLLLSPHVKDEVKSRIVTLLLEGGYDKRLSVVFNEMFIKVNMIPADALKKSGASGRIFNKAYAYACGKIAPFRRENPSVILKTTYDTFETLSDNGNISKINDVNALAASIMVLSKSFMAEEKDLLAQYFDTEKRKINAVLRLVRAKNENS